MSSKEYDQYSIIHKEIQWKGKEVKRKVDEQTMHRNRRIRTET